MKRVIDPSNEAPAAKRTHSWSNEVGHTEGGSNAGRDLDGGSDGVGSHVVENPLDGGLQASGSWDGGSASDAPPGGGGGFRALSLSCDGDGVIDFGGLGAAGNPSDLGCSFSDLLDTDMADCMASLQGNPPMESSAVDMIADPGKSGIRDGSLEGRSDVGDIGGHFEAGSDDGSGSNGVDCGGGTVDGGNDDGSGAGGTGRGGGPVGDFDGGSDDGGDANVIDCDGGTVGDFDGGNDYGIGSNAIADARIGDDYQAVIPDLMYHVGSRSPEKSCREPPLKLWEPGVVSDNVARFAFPQPRRNGSGSSDLEQQMLSAFIISKAGTEDVEALGKVLDAGEGSSWKSNWPDEDREAFRKGIHAFRRDFKRLQASYLPHRTFHDIVDYFYRRWKVNPGYETWKDTNSLIGRRVSKHVYASPTQRNSRGKSLAHLSHGIRRGYVVRKEAIGSEEMFTVRFPRNSSFPEETEVVNIGKLESMIVEGWASDEERGFIAIEDTPHV